MEIFISIGVRLRQIREEMGMSQSEFAAIAEQAGVPGATRQSQANYEKGRQMPSAAYLAAIAAAGADVTYIVTGIRAGAPPVPVAPALNRREQALLENYRGSTEEGKRAVESTASALAHGSDSKKKGGK